MKNYHYYFLIILSLFLLTGCSNNKNSSDTYYYEESTTSAHCVIDSPMIEFIENDIAHSDEITNSDTNNSSSTNMEKVNKLGSEKESANFITSIITIFKKDESETSAPIFGKPDINSKFQFSIRVPNFNLDNKGETEATTKELYVDITEHPTKKPYINFIETTTTTTKPQPTTTTQATTTRPQATTTTQTTTTRPQTTTTTQVTTTKPQTTTTTQATTTRPQTTTTTQATTTRPQPTTTEKYIVEYKNEEVTNTTSFKYGVQKITTTYNYYAVYSDGSKDLINSYDYSYYDSSNFAATDDELMSESNSYAAEYVSYYEEILTLVNQIRAEAGVSPLTLDTTLCQAATMRAVEMDYANIFSHTRPNGTSCFTVFDAYNYSSNYKGENIAAGYQSAASVVSGWKNSPGHYANMVNANFTKLGVGLSMTGVGSYGIYWVQLFAK